VKRRSHRTDDDEFYQLLTYRDDVDLEKKLAVWERFYNGPPKVPSLPQAVWINPPEDKTQSEIKLH
jgi:hypothetical protein